MEEFAFETEKEYEIKDRKVAGIIALSAFVLLLAILHFLGYRIPTPPLPEQLLYKDMEMELIPLEAVVEQGTGGGGSGTPAKVEQADKTPPQMEQVLTTKSSNTHVKSGNSNMTNTNTPNNNPPSGQNVSNNPFGTGGSGGGDGRGNGQGIGDDNGNGEGNGDGPGSGGNPKRFLTEKPNTNNIQSDENVVIVLSVLIDPSGNIIGKPTFVKNGSNTNDMTLINQVINIVKSQARFNKVNATKNMKEAIVIRISAN
jgi:hypothetical protein